MLANIQWAPTHGKTEPLHVLIMTRISLREVWNCLCRVIQSSQQSRGFNEKLKKRPTKAQYYFVLCLKGGTNPKIPLLEEQAALSAFWSSGAYVLRPETAELLGLREHASCMGFFMVARPKVKDSWPMGYRKADWGDKVEWVEWDNYQVNYFLFKSSQSGRLFYLVCNGRMKRSYLPSSSSVLKTIILPDDSFSFAKIVLISRIFFINC